MPKRIPRPPKPRYERYAIAFLVGVAVLAVVVALASLARVRVMITPRAVPVTVDAEVVVVGSGPVSDEEVRGRLASVEGTARVTRPIGGAPPAQPEPATESVGPPVRARGTVTITNAYVQPQPLVATTRLLAPGNMLFRLEHGVVVPPKGKLDGVAVYADQPGSAGNIGPTSFKIPGLSPWLQERVRAESTEPMSGGSGVAPVSARALAMTVRAVVTDADVEETRRAATDAAERDADARARVITAADEEFIVVDGTVQASPTGVAGERRPTVEVQAVVTQTMLVIPRGAFAAAARRLLERRAEALGLRLRTVRDAATRIRVAAADAATGRATVALHAEGEAIPRRESASFDANRIVGFTPDAVRTYLESIPGVAGVEVRFWPFWVQRVPANIGSVDVEVRESDG